MANDQKNLGQNNNPTKEVHRDPVGNLDIFQTSANDESLSNNTFLKEPAIIVASPNENTAPVEHYAYTNQTPAPQTLIEPTSTTTTSINPGEVTSRIEYLRKFFEAQTSTPSQGLNELSGPITSSPLEDQRPSLEPVSYNPNTHFGRVQQRSERLLKKAA